MKIIINSSDGEPSEIITTKSIPESDIPDFIESKGIDYEDIVVKKSVEERVKELEDGVGRDGEGKRGIAQRIDELEDRVSELEDGR